MIEAIATVLSLAGSAVCFAWVIVMHQPREACDVGWWIPEGVRRSGEFVCRPAPRGDTERTARGVLIDHSIQPAGEIHKHVICGGVAVPVIENYGRTVVCR